MHGSKYQPWLQVFLNAHAKYIFATPTDDPGQILVFEFQAMCIFGMYFQKSLLVAGKQCRDFAGTTHGVPLIAQAAGSQPEGITGINFFGDPLKFWRMKPGTTAGRRENAITIKAFLPAPGSRREGPLLWSLVIQKRKVQTADVQIPPPGTELIFAENTGRVRKIEQTLCPIMPTAIPMIGEGMLELIQRCSQGKSKIPINHPVRTRFSGCGYGFVQMTDAPFGIGDQCFPFSPAGCGQEQVTVVGGFGAEVTVLQNDQPGPVKRSLNLLLIGHG